MAGLTVGGFVPETYENIKTRIEARLEQYNPGFDFSPESPDGQLIAIFAFELFQNWQQLDMVYNSYDPNRASGAALRNLGLLTGLPYGAAQRSTATVELQGTAGYVVKRNEIVTDDDGNEFYITFDTTIPSNAEVVSVVAGLINVDASTITTVKSPTAGWTGVTQTQAGNEGSLAKTEGQFRNVRQRTVMRNYTSVADALQARLYELGLGQARVVNNTNLVTLPDGTPAGSIHVTVGEIGSIDPQEVAKVILDASGLGCPTFGNTTETVLDNQGVSHEVSFSTSTQVEIAIVADVTFLSGSTAGAEDNIINALFEHINELPSGENVIWSRLFSYITPYAKAQVNMLTVGKLSGSQDITNVVLTAEEFASIDKSNITLTVTP